MKGESPFPEVLQEVPFVEDLHYTPAAAGADAGRDGELHIKTLAGQFHLVVEIKRSFLTRSAVGQFLAWLMHRGDPRPDQVILLARYISRPVADRLIEAKVNFADDAGNIHLVLGNQYNWTIIGKPAPHPLTESRPVGPAQLQLLFQFVINPHSVTWPVRRLESAAGISKSSVASVRQQLSEEGLLVPGGKSYRLGPARLLRDRLVSGYVQVLRPRLSLGRFRPPEKSGELFLARLRENAAQGFRYALTGAPAAFILQHYYQSPYISLFIDAPSRRVPAALRLLPDREGPIAVLQAFGEIVFGEEREGYMLAPPWLIYAELCASADPRSHEAAEELYTRLLA